MPKAIKFNQIKELLKKDKENYMEKNFRFSLFIKPHQFRRGKEYCTAAMEKHLRKFNRAHGGFIVYFGKIKVFSPSITTGIQGGAHINAIVAVVIFKASFTSPFESTIIRIEDNFAIGNTCGIETRFDISKSRVTPHVGQKVKGTLLEYSDRDGISTLTCKLVK